METDMNNASLLLATRSDNFIDQMFENQSDTNETNESQINRTIRGNSTNPLTSDWIGVFTNFCTFYTIFIIVSGTIGNVLAMLVFFRTKLKKLSSSYYLAALCASDTGFLWLNLMQWLNVVDINIYNREIFCQLFTFLSNTFSVLSVWFVVAFTVERFIAVMYPLKRQTMCTVRRAKSVLICVIIVAAIHSSPLLIVAKSTHKQSGYLCDVRPNFQIFSQYYNYYDTLVAFFLPFALIVVLNAFTAYTVWKLAGVRRTMTNHKRKRGSSSRDSLRRNPANDSVRRKDTESCDSERYSSCTHLNSHHSLKQSCPKSNRQRISNSSQMKVTKMLLIVSTVFVLLNLPSYLFRVRAYLLDNAVEGHGSLIILQYISQELFVTNFGINFVLYCMSGQNFRKEIVGIFRKGSTRRIEVGTQVTVTEFLPSIASNLSRNRPMTRNISWKDAYDMQVMPTQIK